MIRQHKKQKQQRKQKQNTIVNPHDNLFRNALSNKTVAVDFLKQYLPTELQQQIAWKSLEVQKDSFVDANLKNSYCDILYKAKFTGAVADFYILLEHQSEPHKLMPFRLLKYTVQIMNLHLHQHPTSKNKVKPLPLVITLVFYTGKKTFRYSNDIGTLIDAPQQIIDHFFFKPFQLIDLKTINNEDIAAHTWAGLIEIVMKYHLTQSWEQLTPIFIKLIQTVDAAGAIDLIKSTLEYILSTIDKTKAEPLVQQIIHAMKPETGGKIMTMAEWLRNEGRIEGKTEGKMEGKLEKAQEIAVRLLKLGTELEIVSKATQLSPGVIEELKNKKINDDEQLAG